MTLCQKHAEHTHTQAQVRLVHLRPIRPDDNAIVEALARQVMAEFQCVGPGLTSEDPELKAMAQAYMEPDSQYWVLVETPTGRILGSGGFARLRGTTHEEAICDLQKFYFLSEIRGLGLGRMMLHWLMDEACRLGYRTMYLETLSTMVGAIALYERVGFTRLSHQLGNTGHSTPAMVMMARDLARYLG